MDPELENERTHDSNDEGLGLQKPSMQLPSVQEIVKHDPKCVPERFIRELKDRPGRIEFIPSSNEVPVLDLSLLFNGDGDELKKLDSAAKEWGFFQIINHGVSEEVLKKMKAAQLAFFELPFGEKMKYEFQIVDLQGYDHGFRSSDQQKLDWADGLLLEVLQSKGRKMKYWPLTTPGFKDAVEVYTSEMHRVGEGIMDCMSTLMGLKKDALMQQHGEMNVWMRMNYYPACSRPDLVVGVASHSDASSITILLQDDGVTGLQIRYKEQWVPVKPIPNSLTVNIGDSMEGWSNGLYKSVEHRAVTNNAVARMSIATFFHPGGEADIGPVSTMVEGRPRMYRSMSFGDYAKHVFSRELDGKSNVDFLKIG